MKKSPGIGIALSFKVKIFFSVFLAFAGFGVLLCGIIMQIENASPLSLPLIIGGAVAMVLGILFVWLTVKQPKETQQQKIKRNYRALPETDIADYKQELEQTALALQENHQTTFFASHTQSNQLYNPAILQEKCPQLYYSILISVPEQYLKYHTSGENTCTVATVLYSTDENLRYNPSALREVFLSKFCTNKEQWLVPDSDGFFHNKEIAPNLYVCSVAVRLGQLPFGYFSGWLLPIVANPQKHNTVFVVDCDKWTNALIGNFCFGNSKESALTNKIITNN